MNIEYFLLKLEQTEQLYIKLLDKSGKINVTYPENWNKPNIKDEVINNKPQIIDYLTTGIKEENYVIRKVSMEFPMLFEDFSGCLDLEDLKNGRIERLGGDKPVQIILEEGYFKEEEDGEFYYRDQLPDCESRYGLYSEKFKNAIDELGLEYEFAKPVFIYSKEINERFPYWLIIPKVIDCMDRDKTIELRNVVDDEKLKKDDEIIITRGRFAIDNSLRGDAQFFGIKDYSLFHTVPYEVKEKLLKYNLIGVKFVPTNRITKFS